MNQSDQRSASPGSVRAAPQVVHVVAKSGGLSRALMFVLGLFLFAGVFVVGLTIGLTMMFAISNVPTAILEEVYRDGDRNNVAVIPIVGIIESGKAAYVRSAVDYALQQSNIRAIVLRVDSPGGGVTSSDQIWYEIERLKKAGLPIIASYGGVAASGGYYVSCGADEIVAEPTCITGSIGVIAQIFTFEGLMDKVGIEPVTLVATGSPEKNTANDLFRSWNDKDRQKILTMLDAAYDTFNQRVKDGRKTAITDAATIDALADGSIFTAQAAVANGLVDRIGYLDDAITRAETAAGLRVGSSTVVYLRQPPSFSDMLMAHEQPRPASLLDADTIRSFVNDLGSPRVMYLMR
ncbi:MAG: signal peptide peptidase SppA [Phycisphaerales bacterium]